MGNEKQVSEWVGRNQVTKKVGGAGVTARQVGVAVSKMTRKLMNIDKAGRERLIPMWI